MGNGCILCKRDKAQEPNFTNKSSEKSKQKRSTLSQVANPNIFFKPSMKNSTRSPNSPQTFENTKQKKIQTMSEMRYRNNNLFMQSTENSVKHINTLNLVTPELLNPSGIESASLNCEKWSTLKSANDRDNNNLEKGFGSIAKKVENLPNISENSVEKSSNNIIQEELVIEQPQTHKHKNATKRPSLFIPKQPQTSDEKIDELKQLEQLSKKAVETKPTRLISHKMIDINSRAITGSGNNNVEKLRSNVYKNVLKEKISKCKKEFVTNKSNI